MKLLPFVFLFFVHSLVGQRSSNEIVLDLRFYGDAVMNLSLSDHRALADEKLATAVDEFLAIPNSFQESLEEVPWLSVVGNDEFRIITWQLNEGDSIFHYQGRLQKSSGDIVVLHDDKDINDLNYNELGASNWYGARYYSIKPFDSPSGQAYLLFGFNAHNEWNRQKLVDVVHFKDGMPKFGMPVFAKEGESAERHGQFRILLTYSRESRVVFEYDEELDMVVHDHLIQINGRFNGQGPTAVPDGSFEGYRLGSDGVWRHKEKLHDQTSDEPPSDGKIRSETEKRDIFGRKME